MIYKVLLLALDVNLHWHLTLLFIVDFCGERSQVLRDKINFITPVALDLLFLPIESGKCVSKKMATLE